MSRYFYHALILIFLLLFSFLLAGPNIYLYLIRFDNIQNDPSLDWLRNGFVDMVREGLEQTDNVRLQNKADLEEVMNNRSLLLHQPRGSRNLLLLGKFDRSLDKIKVNVQLIDIATWQEVDSRRVVGVYAEIPGLATHLNEAVNTMLIPYSPKIEKARKFPDFVIPTPQPPSRDFSDRSKSLTRSIDVSIDLLEESMDLAIGAREKLPEHNEDVEGVWELDLNVDNQWEDNPENIANTEMLIKVLDNLTKTPYKVRLSRPQFEYDDEDDSRMKVVFPVTYSLKENIIKDMLTSLPYSGLKQDGSLTIFYFNKDKFNFPPNITNRIKYGNYRAVPVIQFYNNAGNPVVVIADTPDAYWQYQTGKKVKFIPTHHFSPLIDFTLGGWSMQIAMETVDIPVKYRFTMDLDRISELNRVSLKFVPINELQTFLADIL